MDILRSWLPLPLCLLVLVLPARSGGQDSREIFDRAVKDFHGGRVADSVAGFDQVVKLAPASQPHLWQRGIALYYAGRYKDCRAQFEAHRTVNPNDVENAAWHFLCVARAESAESARKALLPVGTDRRTPMREIYGMFRGDVTPEQVMPAAGTELEAQFYAHLYAGLYFEALGNAGRALEHIRAAAADRYAMGGYMHSVARVHLRLLEGRLKERP
jgi:lipoprotein NlpI